MALMRRDEKAVLPMKLDGVLLFAGWSQGFGHIPLSWDSMLDMVPTPNELSAYRRPGDYKVMSRHDLSYEIAHVFDGS